MDKIKFDMEDEQHIKIIGIADGKEHEIGQIFTPSGSGENNRNAIQVCGFTEAFDLWGCGIFATPKTNQGGCYEYDDKGKKIYEQVKDIQLKFDIETKPMMVHDRLKVDTPEYVISKSDGKHLFVKKFVRWMKERDVCYGCFNYPCTCEVKVKHRNPYEVKREQDLILLKKEKKNDKGKSTSKEKDN